MSNSYKYVKASLERRAAWFKQLKSKPCSDCGANLATEELDWHHRDPKTKVFSVGRDLYRHGRAQIVQELTKCDLVCRPCHRERHKTLQSSRMASTGVS